MNFNSFFLRSFRILLFPFSLLYAVVILIRNWLYNKKFLRTATFNLPVICIGNLVLGGTGKSPMVEYLIELLQNNFSVATISRGYKRKTKGYALANTNTTALEIGDEPMQFHTKFPNIAVAVGEERVVAIPQLLHDKPNTQVIILDDAFQHRSIKAGLNILLTVYDDLFVDDFFFPTGDLRDQRISSKRAEIIVITKCPEILDESARQKVIKCLSSYKKENIFFTSTEYQTPYHIITKDKKSLMANDEVLLVCGVANPQQIKIYIEQNAEQYEELSFGDHHIFTIDDLKDISKKFEKIKVSHKLILTTEKDAVRLIKFKEQLAEMPVYVLPVKHKFLFKEAEKFNKLITNFINGFKKEINE